MRNDLTRLNAINENRRNRRAAITAKINALDDLKRTLEGYRNTEVYGIACALGDVSERRFYFSESDGECVDNIQYQCMSGSSDTIYSKLNEYYYALDCVIDQINIDMSTLRAERRDDVWLLDDLVNTVDGLLTGFENNNN